MGSTVENIDIPLSQWLQRASANYQEQNASCTGDTEMTPTSIERLLRHIITYSTHQPDSWTKILELPHKIKKGRSRYSGGAASYQGQCELILMDPVLHSP